MKIRRRTLVPAGVAALLLLGALLLTSITVDQARSSALAQSGEGYDLAWWTVDGGGGALGSGGSYQLVGAIGQPDAGPVLSSGDYALAGGFWRVGPAAEPGEYPLYLPLVLRSSG